MGEGRDRPTAPTQPEEPLAHTRHPSLQQNREGRRGKAGQRATARGGRTGLSPVPPHSRLPQFDAGKDFKHFSLGGRLQDVMGCKILSLRVIRGSNTLSSALQVVIGMLQLHIGSE